ncbi:MAG: hypothetical protein ACLFSQ_07790 [Candidatus Zixiibacteriota bacterium]
MPRGRGYKVRNESDPALKNIKQYDAALFYAHKALKNWKQNDYRLLVIKTEKALHVLSKNKLPMIPELKPLYRYYHSLLLDAERGEKNALIEFIQHITELRDTWIQARNEFKKKGFKEE